MLPVALVVALVLPLPLLWLLPMNKSRDFTGISVNSVGVYRDLPFHGSPVPSTLMARGAGCTRRRDPPPPPPRPFAEEEEDVSSVPEVQKVVSLNRGTLKLVAAGGDRSGRFYMLDFRFDCAVPCHIEAFYAVKEEVSQTGEGVSISFLPQVCDGSDV